MNTINLNYLNHLPHCEAVHTSIHHPIKFKLCLENFLSVPQSVVIDGIISYGGSTGIGLNLTRKAYGEFYERNHLFTAIPIHHQKKLTDIKPSDYQNKLIQLCQTKQGDLNELLLHTFSFTTVYHLFTHETNDYFFNSICLNGLKSDSKFLAFSDSCACAVHPLKERALYNSLMEFLERQALLGSWLAQTYRYAINPRVLLSVTPYTQLVNNLLENGELYIFENGNHLPAYTVVMFYFSHHPDDAVQYSIGSSSGLSLKEALISALEELYQCYTFLYNTESSVGLENKAGAGYHIKFQQCNRAETRDIIPFLRNKIEYAINNKNEVDNLKIFTNIEVLEQLSQISTDIYYYHAYNQCLNLHFTKIMSPDFFAHMSLNETLNINNCYAKKLNITMENAYWQSIPFP